MTAWLTDNSQGYSEDGGNPGMVVSPEPVERGRVSSIFVNDEWCHVGSLAGYKRPSRCLRQGWICQGWLSGCCWGEVTGHNIMAINSGLRQDCSVLFSCSSGPYTFSFLVVQNLSQICRHCCQVVTFTCHSLLAILSSRGNAPKLLLRSRDNKDYMMERYNL